MRALKYANYFSSPNHQNDSTASSADMGTTPTTTTPETADHIPSNSQPRKRKSGLKAFDNPDNSQIDRDVPPPRLENDSDIYSEALTEAEDSVDPKEAVDYRRLHRVSFVQRPPRPDYSFKVCLVGNVNVGKTTLLLTLTDGVDTERRTPKVGVGQREKFVFSNEKRRTAKCRLEDTAGQERYKSLTSSFYRNCLGCLVIYDVTREETFNDVDYWFKDVRMYAEAGISVVLVAANNISPLAGEEEAAEALSQRRAISVEEGEKKAEQYEVPYVEANVRKEAEALVALEMLVDRMIEKVEKRRTQTPTGDRYQSPDPRRSYRPSTVTRKSVIAIAAAAAAAQAQAATASPKRVTTTAASPRVDLSAPPPSVRKAVSCC